jgi:preprotein translocase subunit YajC
MNNLLMLTTDTTSSGNSTLSMVIMIAVYAVFILALYFIFFRPNNKKKKKEEEMRKNAEVGDEITTIGGIVGKIVAVKEESDSIIVETGSDRSRIRVKRWAIGSVDTIHDDAETK